MRLGTRRRSAASLAGTLAIVGGLLAASCGSSRPDGTTAPESVPVASEPAATPNDTPGTSARALDAAAVATARRALEKADVGDDASIDALSLIRFTPVGAEAARQVLTSNVSEDATWAAIWVYATAGSDPVPLRRHAQAQDPSIAVLAAATLVGFGDGEGFSTLARLLPINTQLRGSHPPIAIGDFALRTLTRYVAAPGAPSTEADEAIPDPIASWTNWLVTHGGGLAFDEPTGTWTIP